MSGEAYFEVEHDAASPFIVSSGGLDIKVLGTKFNSIRNDAARHRVTTVLLEGSWPPHSRAARSMRSACALHRCCSSTARPAPCSCATAPPPPTPSTGLRATSASSRPPSSRIVSELERYYNVEVRFMDDSLRGERFSGDFHLEDGIYHIMSVLQLTYKFHYKVNRDNIELYAN